MLMVNGQDIKFNIMKYIITEKQHKLYIQARRRLFGFAIAKDLIESSFYDDIEFCDYFDSFDDFLKSYIEDVRNEYYEYFSENSDDTLDPDDLLGFIWEGEFVKTLMEQLGDELIKFYNERTENC